MPRPMRYICTIALLLGSGFLPLNAAISGREFTSPVATHSGPVVGEIGSGVASFKGIPYAAPPVGVRRWKPPEPVAPWTQPLLATAFGPACPQDLTKSSERTPDSTDAFVGPIPCLSEDCLYLNVWTPRPTPAKPLPVFVYFHGGRLIEGSSSQPKLDGTRLASKGAVVVTANYRLGVLGFLACSSLSAESPQKISGNYGVMDAVAALRWVHDNVAAFGGDPANVTVAGQAIPLTLLTVPEARGLLNRAIVCSAAMPLRLRDLSQMQGTLESSEELGARAIEAMGITPGPGDLEAMRAVPWQGIVQARIKASGAYASQARNALCVDGMFVPGNPVTAFAEGRQNAVPLLIGTDADEGTLLEHPFDHDTPEQFRSLFERMLGDHAAQAFAFYPFTTPEEAKRQFVRMQTDAVMFTAHYFAHENAQKQPDTYLYQFDRDPKWAAQTWRQCFHGIDIAYLFGNLTPADYYDADDRAVSDQMMERCLQFMRTNAPNLPGQPVWPPYKVGEGALMRLDVVSRPDAHLRREAMDLWSRWAKSDMTKK